MCLSRGGRCCISAMAPEEISVGAWRTRDGECIRTFKEHEAAVTHVVISANGSILASGAEDGTVCVRKMNDILPGGYGTDEERVEHVDGRD